MMQTKLQSLLEAIINVSSGYILAVITAMVALPIFGLKISLFESMGLSAIFTVVSVARTYCIRRFFNYWHGRKNVRNPDSKK